MSRCPDCGGKARVLETREAKIGTRRRRQCLTCGQRFTTYELAVIRLLAAKTDPARPDVDPAEIAGEVIERLDSAEIADEVVDRLEELIAQVPEDTVAALLDEAERQRDEPRELLPGDDD
jgi:transcriptional repressor NrdR